MEAPQWHTLSTDDTLRQLSSRAEGLTSVEAGERLVRFGRNEIARRKPISPLRLFLKQFANFFIVVLLFAAALAYVVSFMPGESGRRMTAFLSWASSH
jgi:Ca2+-transporting ATPase